MYSFPTDISNFYLIGVNYKKTDAVTRGFFSVNDEKHKAIIQLANAYHVQECFVLSTCNRTEIYGLADDPVQLASLLASQTSLERTIFDSHLYSKKGADAVAHLFYVAAGLDSQILGDYEIIYQIKKAITQSKEAGGVGPFLDRLANIAVQCSRKVKTNTALSSGTVSVSFAAIQYLKQQFPLIKEKNILLIGAGKFSRLTCKNLIEYTGSKNITLLNRTVEKAASIAAEFGLLFAPLSAIKEYVDWADIILVATDASTPVLMAADLVEKDYKTIIDLSIPYNVDEKVKLLPNITLINVDELSKIKDETLAARQADIPAAKLIIEGFIQEFIEWNNMRRQVPALVKIKSTLTNWYSVYGASVNEQQAIEDENTKEKIQAVINTMATKMKSKTQHGCNYLEVVKDFITTHAVEQ